MQLWVSIIRPLISSNVIDLENIILDMKCAVSGAGRAMREDLLHSEASEGIRLMQWAEFIDIWVNLIRNFHYLLVSLCKFNLRPSYPGK